MKNLSAFVLVLGFCFNAIAQVKGSNPKRKTPEVKKVEKSFPLRLIEFRTAPIALLARWYTIDVSYRLNKNISTGPAAVIYGATGEYGNMLAPTYKGHAIGWQANYYFNSVMKNSWYLGVRGYSEKYKAYPHSSMYFEKRDGFRGNVFFGFQSKWSRVNLLFGAGIEHRSHKIKEEVLSRFEGVGSPGERPDRSDSIFGPMLEFKLGFEI